jgi:hypothetical protein
MNAGSGHLDGGAPNYAPIRKAAGGTLSEKYLADLCERNFLSLWSFPSVYRDEGILTPEGHGKEVCDLLVVFDQNIIIFSDKQCQFSNSGNMDVDWRRWFKKAIEKAAKQAWGAETWIRNNPSRIYLDRSCKNPLPIDLPAVERAHFHLVVVAHGVSEQIKAYYSAGSSGSLMLDSDIKGLGNHTSPFYIGDLNPGKTFVHILDDNSLETLMSARDTISDFVSYLSKRAALFRKERALCATGEEELLAIYLKSLNDEKDHDFIFPEARDATKIFLTEGHWLDFNKSPQRTAQLKDDEISYSWDKLIETFNGHALRGEQHFVTKGGLKDCEQIMRFMAREPRWMRRYLAHVLLETVATTPSNQKRITVIPPRGTGDPYYVFLLLSAIHAKSEEEYRLVRRELLSDCCLVVRLQFPDAKDVVGIATEPGLGRTRSEDAIYFNARGWTAEMETYARRVQSELSILTKPTQFRRVAQEYPSIPVASVRMKNPRNKPCPCGSGEKYKYCCLNKLR